MKTITALALVWIMSFLLIASVSGQSANSFKFEIDSASATPGATTTRPLCATQTISGVGNTYTVVPDFYVIFRFGIGFGTLNSVSNPRIVHWFNSTIPPEELSIEDLEILTNAASGRITLYYDGEVNKSLAFRDQICIDASWTAPASSTEGIVDMNVVVPGLSQTEGKTLFVR